MIKQSVCLLVVLLFLQEQVVRAKIGETIDQIGTAFGKPVASGDNNLTYKKGDFVIDVYFQNRISVAELVYKAPVIDTSTASSYAGMTRWLPGGGLSENEIKVLLGLFGGGKAWTPVSSGSDGFGGRCGRSWTRTDGVVLALDCEAAIKESPKSSITDLDVLMFTPYLEFANTTYLRAVMAQQVAEKQQEIKTKKRAEEKTLSEVFSSSSGH